MLRFGIRFQANWLTVVARDQGVNAAVAVVGGVYSLGLWSLASRLMLLPLVLFETLGRVTFPAISHTLGAGRDARPFVERATRISLAVAAIGFSAFVASTPGIVPALFGEKWQGAIVVFPGTCLGLMIAGGLGAGAIPYLFASDRPGTVVRATAAGAVAWLAATIITLPVVGVAAVGIGSVAAAIAEGAVLAVASRRYLRADVVTPLLVPVPVAIAATAAGWGIAVAAGADLMSGALGAAAAAAIAVAGLAVFARDVLADTMSIAMRSVADALGRKPIDS